MTDGGLPHSEISGSKSVCDSPKRIAAYRVLHRLLTPSHPPQTLRSLTLYVFSRAKPSSINIEMLISDCIDFEDVRLTLYEIVKEQKIFWPLRSTNLWT